MTTKLVLIRHAMTEWNKQGRYCGYKDISLSSKGRWQAIKLRKRFKEKNFDKIYCSDRKRALQTRYIVFGRSSFIKLNDLREINFGGLEGLKHKQIMKKYAQTYEKWLQNPYKGNIAGMEPRGAFKKRVLNVMRNIVRSNCGKRVAVVCHGGVIAILVADVLKSKDFWGHLPSSASITVVEHRNRKFEIRKFNDKKHLR